MRVLASVGLVQQLGVLHDLCCLLQDGAWLHDPDGHAEQRGHVHANVLLELLGPPRLLPLLQARGGVGWGGVGWGGAGLPLRQLPLQQGACVWGGAAATACGEAGAWPR